MPDESPITAARFGITVDGVQIAQFSELLRLAGSSTDYVESGQDALLLDALVAKRTPPEMTLRRPRSSDLKLQSWYHSKVRKTCKLTIHSTTGSRVATYSLTQCWPKTLEFGGFKAGGSRQMMETVTIVAERIQRVSP
jgi:phage tail-like protein